jgi:hypothetical protein
MVSVGGFMSCGIIRFSDTILMGSVLPRVVLCAI